jgi:hypothetical protein
MCASSLVILLFLTHVTFIVDEWDFLLHRRGFSADVVLEPHNEHISVLPVLIYKALLAMFGMESARPFQIVSTALFLAMVAVLFVFLRRRMGEWLALAAVLPVLFLGASYDTLLFPFEIGFFCSIGFGIATLLALERDDRSADLLATGLLIGSLSSSSLGLSFAIGAGVWLVLARERRHRLWVTLGPLALFGLWWLGWGRHAENGLSVDNVLSSAGFVLDGVSASLSSLLGLATSRGGTEVTTVGRPLLAAAGALLALRLWRRPVPEWLPALAAILLSFWFLAAFNASPERTAAETRYMLFGVVGVLLVASPLVGRPRLGRMARISVATVAVLAAAGNFEGLRQGHDAREFMSANERAGLAAIEIARDSAPAHFRLSLNDVTFAVYGLIDAGSYLSAVDAYGSPAYSERELASAPEYARVSADRTLVRALGIKLTPTDGSRVGSSDCERVAADDGPVELNGTEPILTSTANESVAVGVSRYAPSVPNLLGELKPGDSGALVIPEDRSRQPWDLILQGTGTVAVCA